MVAIVNDEILRIAQNLSCGHCGCTFQGSHSQARKVKYEKRTVYCGKACMHAGVYGKLRKPMPVHGPCPTCNEMFESRSAKKYCSMDCYTSSEQFKEMRKQNLELSDEAREQIKQKLRKGEDVACLECGCFFYQKPPSSGRQAKKFCTKSCYRQYMAKRFDRWVADPQGLALPQCYDEFLSGSSLPCLISGCNWEGEHLGGHLNLAHGITADEFKKAAGFNLGTGLVSTHLSKKLSETNTGKGRQDIFEFSSAESIRSSRYVSLESRERRKKVRADAAGSTGPKRRCMGCGAGFHQPSIFGRKQYCSVECRSAAYAGKKRAASLRPNHRQRDMEITRKVLSGDSQSVVARQYGISNERVRQITHKCCRGSNVAEYERIRREKGGNIEHLQESKDIFLP